MNNKLFLINILSWLFFESIAFSQIQEYKSSNFEYVGSKDKHSIYRYRHVNNPIGELPNSLYKAELNDNRTVSFSLLEKLEPKNRTLYIDDFIEVYLFNRELIITYDGNKRILQNIPINKNGGIAFDNGKKHVFFSIKTGNSSSQLAYIDLSLNNSNITILPILGRKLILSGEYLYFASDHICDWYSAYIDDVYRVKIGDWNNPELILQNTETSWSVLPNSNIIYADILEDRAKRVLFNADTKTYAITDVIGSSTIVRYNGEFYFEVKMGQGKGLTPVVFAKNYPNQDNRSICPPDKKRLFNLPNSKKPFANTFITEELLYNSTEAELNKLEKKQLRILRNAFFARQGYKFKSDDLREFFGQFDWYNVLLKSYKVLEITNEDVVISPKDKERVDIITKIENSK